jgi:hypothetical protein
VVAACDRLLPYRLRSPPSDLRVPVVLTALREIYPSEKEALGVFAIHLRAAAESDASDGTA